MMNAIGLMSGTSMDGIDGVILQSDGSYDNAVLMTHSIRYQPAVYALLKSVATYAYQQQGQFTSNFAEYIKQNISHEHADIIESQYDLNLSTIIIDDVCHLSTTLHLQVVNELMEKANMTHHDIEVIGYHGQTLYHDPAAKLSIQMGDANFLAQTTKINVVSDFRQNDLLAGGQGAPLAPIYHYALAKQSKFTNAAVINCGGIANITIVDTERQALCGFDTGPGNVLIDSFVYERTKGQLSCDLDGHFAKSGRVMTDALSVLYDESMPNDSRSYFDKAPPKSLDAQQFKLPECFRQLSIEDGCRTLLFFTVKTIVDSISATDMDAPKHWCLVGGGWNNPCLNEVFKKYVFNKYPTAKVLTASQCGWDNPSLEAQLIAYCATRYCHSMPITFSTTTGVAMPLTGGQCYTPKQLK